MKTICFERNGIYVDLAVEEDGRVTLRSCAAVERPRPESGKGYPLCEVQGVGYDHDEHHGSKHIRSSPGAQLRYESHTLTDDAFTLTQASADVRVTTRWQFYAGVRALRATTEVACIGSEPFLLEYVSSFALMGLGYGSDARSGDYRVHLPHNTWYGECQWTNHTLSELGYHPVTGASLKRIALSSTGTWACSEHLPMGAFTQPGHAMLWQIETSGSWGWEISDYDKQLYLLLSGPSGQEHQFMKALAPGETFVSAPCAVAFGSDFEDSVGEMTKYRRRIRRPNEDNAHPSVIFNDFMNCLWGDPTTDKELPLIDAAAEAGCRYYCVDCGWYADGHWWNEVGQWLPSGRRFPGGIEEVLAYIRKKGMIPGLWLELEVMGTKCPLADQVPDDWFFTVGGRRVIDHGRYQLDFRNPDVIRHADAVVDRLVTQYGVGYIKMDYNINAGVGTQRESDSAGEGLLAHNRAYLAWLDRVFARYPELVMENCSSGGMRMEYSLLSRHSIQSVTDQDNYVKMAAIACNCMTALTPEQAAIWSYPRRSGDEEETIFNMVSAMLMRIHQSGHLAELSAPRLTLVREGIAVHLSIAEKLKDGLPFWPLGLGSLDHEFLAVGVRCGAEAYLAVWHTREGEATVTMPSRGYAHAQVVYPAARPVPLAIEDGQLSITLSGVSARLLRLW